ncbi:hypothetical protein PR048_023334 [Dryococelus australis]|uniref:Transposase n=1 Tax=Dryococelus australis TaxID=614101 RepID=A0ABQ9GTY8_9NEOP|nr:hypothetical protein PR048_023334 [Dryococelus australis]
MLGVRQGVQTIVKKEQPLALFVICGAHCINLVIKYSAECSLLRLRKRKLEMKDPPLVSQIKPLFPMRWLYRGKQMSSIMDNYSSILDTLEEMMEGCSSKASAFYNFSFGETVLGLLIITDIINLLEMNQRKGSREQWLVFLKLLALFKQPSVP